MRLINVDNIYFRCSYNGDCMASAEQCRKCRDYVCDYEDIENEPTALDVEQFIEEMKGCIGSSGVFMDEKLKEWIDKFSV